MKQLFFKMTAIFCCCCLLLSLNALEKVANNSFFVRNTFVQIAVFCMYLAEEEECNLYHFVQKTSHKS